MTIVLSDPIRSVIRTAAPAAAGALLTWLSTFGLEVTDEASTGLTAGLVFVLSTAWYLAARVLEGQWPSLGWLLGSPHKPTYPTGGEVPAMPDGDHGETKGD